MRIGTFTFSTPIILAPMAGVTEPVFRRLCCELGADFAVSEMVKAHSQLHLPDAQTRRHHKLPSSGPHSVQIIGNDPAQMAAAAQMNVELGADIIDINMGCPAKKFAKKPAGSALLAQPDQVQKILHAVVTAVNVPVTLKIRTGVDAGNMNALQIGRIAQGEGVQALSVHGRTRSQRFTGLAEHDTTRQLVDTLDIPVIANGDINSPEMAVKVLQATGAAGLMIGRAARNNPWIFAAINHALGKTSVQPDTSPETVSDVLLRHLGKLYEAYDEDVADRLSKKQLGWCVSGYRGAAGFRSAVRDSCSREEQERLLYEFFWRDECRVTAAG